MIIEDALNIYTDGSSLSGPRKGGIGIRFITINDKGDEEIRDIELPGYKGATNNQMELYACKQALKEAQKLYDSIRSWVLGKSTFVETRNAFKYFSTHC